MHNLKRVLERFFIAALIAATIFSCKTPAVLVSERDNAVSAAAAGNYELAVRSWQNYFNAETAAGRSINSDEFVLAANDAYKAGNQQFTVDWFEEAEALGYENADMYLIYIEIFQQQNNLQRELNALQHFVEKYPEHNSVPDFEKRLFDIYLATDKDKAYSQWSKLGEATKNEEKYLDQYFKLNKARENKQRVDSLANVLLKINPQHVAALEWNGEKYYWIAENHYQAEMDKYNKKKTTTQYTLLVHALKQVTKEFQQALVYFDRLWEIKQEPRYAAFMSNIYARFDNKERAAYYRKLSQ